MTRAERVTLAILVAVHAVTMVVGVIALQRSSW